MTYTDKAIQTFGFEDVRTITIAVLEEQGKTELAEKLFRILTEEEEEVKQNGLYQSRQSYSNF